MRQKLIFSTSLTSQKGESQSQIRDEIFKDIKEILNILIQLKINGDLCRQTAILRRALHTQQTCNHQLNSRIYLSNMNTKHTQERREGDNLELAHCLHITSTQLVERKSKDRALASTHRHIYKLTKASKGIYIHRLSHTHKPIHGRWSYHSTSTHKGHSLLIRYKT